MTLSLLNSLAAAANMVLGGVAGRKIPTRLVLFWAALAAFLVSLVALGIGGGSFSARGVTLGAIAGVSGGIGLLMAYRAFAIGPVGIVGAILATTSTGFGAVVGFVTEHSATPLRGAGLALCIVSIAVVSAERGRVVIVPAALILAVLAGLAAGGFAILMNQAEPADGFGPLVVVRAAVLIVALGILLGYKPAGIAESSAPNRWPAIGIAIAAGCSDALANIFVILALQVIDLATIAIISAITPALVALIGWLALKEPLLPRQIAGLAIAVSAIALTGQPIS